ncbi:MAG TPA: signal peptidase I [Novosphingobium sp.]|nr:signal peptidase I [Novosphingobium sp.]
MTEPATPPPADSPARAEGPAAPAAPARKEKEESFLVFLLKLVVLVAVFRSFIFSPFNIPSESMLPRLVNGDYLLAAKWPYGFSSYSLPFSVPLLPGRMLAHQPVRGDVVIFKAPPANEQDWIKRVIGLPGDIVQMQNGVLYLNGKAIPKVKIEDFEIAVSANTSCYQPHYTQGLNYEVVKPDGSPNGRHVCRYPQYRETLPAEDGRPAKSFNVLDLEQTPQDNTPPYLVPEGSLFLMGDDRDNSMDSRFSTIEGGIGMVPQANLVGRATIVMWSTDGGAQWYAPWTWFTSARWRRIGGLF